MSTDCPQGKDEADDFQRRAFIAAWSGDETALRDILTGDFPTLRDSDGKTLFCASMLGGVSISSLIDMGADVNALNSDGTSALFHAFLDDDGAAVAELLNCGANTWDSWFGDGTALHLAAMNDARVAIEAALRYGVSADLINASDTRGFTVLMTAVESGHHAVAAALINAGADVNAYDANRYCETALHVAAERGDRKCIELLLRAGASLEIQDSHGRRPADLYLEAHEKDSIDVEVLRMLLRELV
ncbi:MAG: ankyrin repeat domain-containing protein [Planctomyces sp.]|nr:ankyrin repeat domain-containing protein [Planctomyces sp.]